jgi:glucose dehydrogenase
LASLSPLGLPCNPPPWGTLAAVDMNAGTIKWQVPLGLSPYGGFKPPTRLPALLRSADVLRTTFYLHSGNTFVL